MNNDNAAQQERCDISKEMWKDLKLLDHFFFLQRTIKNEVDIPENHRAWAFEYYELNYQHPLFLSSWNKTKEEWEALLRNPNHYQMVYNNGIPIAWEYHHV